MVGIRDLQTLLCAQRSSSRGFTASSIHVAIVEEMSLVVQLLHRGDRVGSLVSHVRI